MSLSEHLRFDIMVRQHLWTHVEVLYRTFCRHLPSRSYVWALCFRFCRASRFCVAPLFACGALLGIHNFYIIICGHFGPSSDSSFPIPAGAGAGLPLCLPCRTARMAENDFEEEAALSSTQLSTSAPSSVPPLAGIAADMASMAERFDRFQRECQRQNLMRQAKRV